MDKAISSFHGTLGSQTLRIVIAFLLIYIVWGSTYLAIRVGVGSFPPFLLGTFRFLMSGFVMLALAFLRHEEPKLSRIDTIYAVVVGMLLFVGCNGLVMIAEQTVASGFAALIIAIIPLWVTGFEYVSHSSERLSARGIFGIILGFVGLAVLVAPDVLNQKFTLSISEGMLVLATLFWAAGSWVQRRHKFHASLFTLSAAQMLASGTVMGVISLAQNDCRLEVLAAVNTQSWLALAYLIVFGSCTAFTAYVYLLRNVPASRVATYAYVNPIVAVLLGALILHESLTISMLAGMTIILVSLSMVRS